MSSVANAISSLQHPLVKHLVKLRDNSTYRYEQQSLLLEGPKPIQEVSVSIMRLFYTPAYASFADTIKIPEKWQITEPILHKISNMPAPEGLLAEVRLPPFQHLAQDPLVVALDGISDPGNLGTLMRTALALGWEAIYLLPGSCDVFNEKVLRAARGAHFKLKLIKGSVEQLVQWVQTERVQALVADIQGIKPEQVTHAPRRLLVLGNEAHGASPAMQRLCQAVTIPMPGDMESLNVAVAGGILFYLLKN